jgi:hypothetical protein
MIDELCTRLMKAARAIGWAAADEPSYVSKRFRGRDEDVEVLLPPSARGLRLGRYPVLVSTIALDSSEAVVQQLQTVHNQMVLARSFMRAHEVIDAHIFLVASPPTKTADWVQLIDLVERNESVCRKIVWLPHSLDMDQSYQNFVDRTFLAQPWNATNVQDNAPLDQNEKLVQRVLEQQGLSAAAAAEWVSLADRNLDLEQPLDSDEFVDQVVAAMEKLQ